MLSIKYTIEIAEGIRAAFVAQKGIEPPKHIEKLVKPCLLVNIPHILKIKEKN